MSVKFVLLIFLAWMLLLEEGIRLNMSQEANVGCMPEKVEIQSEAAPQKEEIQNEAAPQSEEIQSETAPQKSETQQTVQNEMTNIPQKSEPKEKEIRVLLMDTGYQSYFHPSVTVAYSGKEVTYTAFDTETFPIIIPKQEEGIVIKSIERQEGNPRYQGSLEIRSTPDGLLLINELPLESYLESVVPSEMPSSYEAEALKAQAVCARTYACRQMQEARLKEYGADVDDSVRFQVYCNIPPQKSTSKAVHATEGEVLCQNGELIQAYYFSTSSGATSTDEIWGAEEEASYLKAVSCQFDKDEPWSSWSVRIPWSMLDGRVSGGALKSLEITRKNQSDAVTGLHVVTDEGSFDLTEEYGIRDFLSPMGCTILEKDGTTVQGGSLLPSAYFTMEVNPGDFVAIQGRGYGHGVGMSQTAANQMAAQGYSYLEILDYFFREVEIQQVDTKEDS